MYENPRRKQDADQEKKYNDFFKFKNSASFKIFEFKISFTDF